MITKSLPLASMNIESAVYDAALVLDGEERRTFLERAFFDDPEGLARMQALLESTGESSAFFLEATEHRSALAGEILKEVPPVAGADVASTSVVDEELGSFIGPYRLVSRIGEGGWGVVYEAEQMEPVRRHVALKIIRLGMDTERVIARFEAERQALAMMDHPNIARVFDAGATAGGRPYFVMERVSGEKITCFCDREKLDVVARIHLFIQVCSAIQHAHQKSVIHRDIKPSNVLVAQLDGTPVPKVIDFGIAKAADSHGGRGHTRTSLDQIMGTPPYMSPEQVDMSGIDIDTRSDVYSLGALLYELLGGRAPFDSQMLADAGVSGMRRILLEKDPPLLSRMLAELPEAERAEIAALRGTDAAKLVASLRGDLDWIVAKAMAKDRNLRYQTVNALAADLGRFLADEPVLARRPSRFYLTRKFIRRNRVVCVFAMVAVVSLMSGLGVSTWLYFGERRALAEQERLGREAESARALEAHMRTQAQARANVSQAAVLLTEGKIREADALLQKSPLESIEPSREAASVFRALGNWNAFYGRWKKAVQCYSLLNQANRLDQPGDIVEGCEVLAIASALIEDGDRVAYEKFRKEAIELYLPARNSLQAEHLLQACLLLPPDEDILKRLQEVAEICRIGVGPEPPAARWPDWEAFSMALYFHRLGDSAAVMRWAQECLSYSETANLKSPDARVAATLCLVAMTRYRMGEKLMAQEDLRHARALIAEDNRTKSGREPSEPGSWYTWVIARQLLKEAEADMGVHALPKP